MIDYTVVSVIGTYIVCFGTILIYCGILKEDDILNEDFNVKFWLGLFILNIGVFIVVYCTEENYMQGAKDVTEGRIELVVDTVQTVDKEYKIHYK